MKRHTFCRYIKSYSSDHNQYNHSKSMKEYKLWDCNLKSDKCIGCGTVICPLCLKEPLACECENKDRCCNYWIKNV